MTTHEKPRMTITLQWAGLVGDYEHRQHGWVSLSNGKTEHFTFCGKDGRMNQRLSLFAPECPTCRIKFAELHQRLGGPGIPSLVASLLEAGRTYERRGSCRNLSAAKPIPHHLRG